MEQEDVRTLSLRMSHWASVVGSQRGSRPSPKRPSACHLQISSKRLRGGYPGWITERTAASSSPTSGSLSRIPLHACSSFSYQSLVISYMCGDWVIDNPAPDSPGRVYMTRSFSFVDDLTMHMHIQHASNNFFEFFFSFDLISSRVKIYNAKGKTHISREIWLVGG